MSTISNIKRFVSQKIKNNFLYHKWKKFYNKAGFIINNVLVSTPNRKSNDIQDWRNALQNAEGYTQSRVLLYDLYKEALLDGHLKNAIRKRILSITNKDLIFHIDGKEVEDIIALTEKTFFSDLLEEIMNARFYGHSLIELDWAAPNADQQSDTMLIPRKHVKPRFGIVTPEQFGMDGIQYREEPFKDRLIEVGDHEDLGLILEACQYVIYKKGAFGDWAEYAEVFGMPFRWATYDNEQTRQVLEEAMEKAGSAGYVVAPKGAELNFKGADTQSGTGIFDDLRKACNEEISILILGNTMTTTEARSSGYAQSKTHQKGQDEVHADDRKFILRHLQEKLNPILERLGYKVKGGKWAFKDEESTTLKDKLDIVLKVNKKVPVPASYYYETFKIPMPSADDLPAGDNDTDDDKEPDDSKKQKKKLSANRQVIRRNDLHTLHDQPCHHSLRDFSIRFAKLDKNVVSNFLTQFYKKQIKINDLHDELFRNYYIRLIQFAEAGFAQSMYKPQTLEQLKAFESFKRNLASFAAHKNQMLNAELSGLAKLPFKDYLKEAQKVAKRFNEDYLKAELSVANVSADSATRWADYQKEKDLYPNLRYETAGDERVRASHAAMDEKVFAIDDPIWDTWMPPNGYRCRCITIQSDDPVSKQPPKGTGNVDKGFAHNSGKTLLVYDDKHPYFGIKANTSKRLNQKAELLRSVFEQKEILANAIKSIANAKFSLPATNSQVVIGKEQLHKAIKSKHSRAATKNALLAALPEIFTELQFIRHKGKTHFYQFDFLGDPYIFKFYQSKNGLELIGITNSI